MKDGLNAGACSTCLVLPRTRHPYSYSPRDVTLMSVYALPHGIALQEPLSRVAHLIVAPQPRGLQHLCLLYSPGLL